ncbi:hypothetical protein LJK87_39590 [Paenibacillus sp. P25]|nr:hypothetical protein LJK87_39590 [Paenibacillus sp. P25]
MNLVYAGADGQVYDHPDFLALGRSGEMVTEIMEEELIPLPEGATLVSLPDTRPIGIDRSTGEMKVVPGDVMAVGALLPQGFTRSLLPGYAKTDRTKARLFSAIRPLYGRTAGSMWPPRLRTTPNAGIPAIAIRTSWRSR